METSLSPEAVEDLARSLAVKLGIKDRTDTELYNLVLDHESADRKRAQDDEEFRTEVRATLQILKKSKSDLPALAISIAILAAFFSVLSLVGTARATERLSSEIREIRENMVFSNEVRRAP